jgi:hypothetical protein
MILKDLHVGRTAFEAETGWILKPQGACRGEVCVPLSTQPAEMVDVAAIAKALHMPLIEDAEIGLWALGPANLNGKALVTAQAPDMVLRDLSGSEVRLSRFKGKKILIYAWAPY